MKKKGNSQTRRRLLAGLSIARRTSEDEGRRLTVTAVAREAGVSHTLVFRYYPDIVEKIRRFAKNTGQRTEGEVSQEQNRLAARLSELQADVASLEKINHALRLRHDDLARDIDTTWQKMREAGGRNEVRPKKEPPIEELLKELAESSDVAPESREGPAVSTLEALLIALRAEEKVLRAQNRTIASRNATMELVIGDMERYVDNTMAGAIPLKPFRPGSVLATRGAPIKRR